MDPHIAEDEDLQRLKDWWKKNGSSIIVGVVVGIGAIIGINGWNYYTDNRDKTASTLFSELQQHETEGSLEAVEQIARELRDDFSATPYAANGALIVAARLYENGDVDSAREMLNWTLTNTDDENIEQVARLRLAYLELGAGNAETALEIANVNNPGSYASHYAELRAAAYSHAGNYDAAIKAYDEAIAALVPGSTYVDILDARKNRLQAQSQNRN
ncbi:MAG: hypothetical protein DHS20C01_02250 [marine bacterium B5-7]|nr:MAG: hypothetical protein DHS20C01_02250 [marine bacterium B5-7]